MIAVILESPFAADDKKTAKRNLEYARAALLDSLQRGEAPFASHLLYTQVLDDKDPMQRAQGLASGLAWYYAATQSSATTVVFYVDYGISPGMLEALERAQAEKTPIIFRRIIGGATKTQNEGGAE